MAWETIECLQDNGLEVIVDLEHAMDADCGRRENGIPCDADLPERSLDYFHQLDGAVRAPEGEPHRGVRHQRRREPRRSDAGDRRAGAAIIPMRNFGFHGHTDRGLGVANTRAAILAGAVQVQGTLLGTGERCGNVNLTTVIGGMQLRGEAEFVPPESLRGLTSLAHSAYAAFGLETPHGAPIVGPGAFGTWAGMHGSSERKNPGAYLWCDPAQVGASPTIGVNAQSGTGQHHAAFGSRSACRSTQRRRRR